MFWIGLVGNILCCKETYYRLKYHRASARGKLISGLNNLFGLDIDTKLIINNIIASMCIDDDDNCTHATAAAQRFVRYVRGWPLAASQKEFKTQK